MALKRRSSGGGGGGGLAAEAIVDVLFRVQVVRLHPGDAAHLGRLSRAHDDVSLRLDGELDAVRRSPAPSPAAISALLALDAVRADAGSIEVLLAALAGYMEGAGEPAARRWAEQSVADAFQAPPTPHFAEFRIGGLERVLAGRGGGGGGGGGEDAVRAEALAVVREALAWLRAACLSPKCSAGARQLVRARLSLFVALWRSKGWASEHDVEIERLLDDLAVKLSLPLPAGAPVGGADGAAAAAGPPPPPVFEREVRDWLRNFPRLDAAVRTWVVEALMQPRPSFETILPLAQVSESSGAALYLAHPYLHAAINAKLEQALMETGHPGVLRLLAHANAALIEGLATNAARFASHDWPCAYFGVPARLEPLLRVLVRPPNGENLRVLLVWLQELESGANSPAGRATWLLGAKFPQWHVAALRLLLWDGADEGGETGGGHRWS